MTAVPSQVRPSSEGLYTEANSYDDPQIEQPVYHTTETRRSFVTTEFWVMLAAAVAIMVSAYNDAAFDIDQGWTLVTAIVVGYLLSRGFAKAGSREEYTRDS